MEKCGFYTVPMDRHEDALTALHAAFGPRPRDWRLQPVTGGSSGALTYRLEVGAKPYLMRLETARDAIRDPYRSYA